MPRPVRRSTEALLEAMRCAAAKREMHPFDWKSEEKPTVEDYFPFVHVVSLGLREQIKELLAELHAVTGESWRPSGCYSTGGVKGAADRLQAEGKLSGIEITPMAYQGDSHFFLTAKFPDFEKPMVIDPFGVPQLSETPDADHLRHIIPFFGDPVLAPPYHQRVYQGAEPIEGERTRPRFHP